MPFKLKLGGKNCLECDSYIEHKITRDIERKKFCNHSCRGKFAGKRYSKEHMENMRKLGSTIEVNLKKARKGEANGRYIKDRSKIKTRSRHENTEWKKEIFKRDNYTCRECEQYGGRLQADHIKPYSLFPELRWELSNGRTLCIDCHKKTNTYGAKIKKLTREDFYV